MLSYKFKNCVKSYCRFQKHLDSGLLEVIAPPEGYYPDFNNLRNTLGDTVERVRLVDIFHVHCLRIPKYKIYSFSRFEL